MTDETMLEPLSDAEHGRQFGDDVKAVRRRLGLTQAEFAHGVGVEQATVSRWEKGVEPTPEKLRLLLGFLKGQNIQIGESFRAFSRYQPSQADQLVAGIMFAVPIVGHVSASGEVVIYNLEKRPNKDVAGRFVVSCPGAAPATVAITKSVNFSAEAGSIETYYFDNTELPPLSGLLPGFLNVSKIKDGPVFLGRSFPTQSTGRYNLVGEGGVMHLDVELRWQSRVRWILAGG